MRQVSLQQAWEACLSMLERRVPRGALPCRNHRLDATSSEAQSAEASPCRVGFPGRCTSTPEQLEHRTSFQGRDGGIIGRCGTPIWRRRDHLSPRAKLDWELHFRAKII